MKEINSRTNQTVKQIYSLHTTKGRKLYNQCIAEGLRTCTTMLKGYKLVQLYITKQHTKTALSLCAQEKITVVADHVMDKLSSVTTPSGILGVFELPPIPTTDQLSAGVVLAQLSTPGNAGTLIRTCAAMGYTSVICIDSVDPWSPKVVQASTGAVALVTLFQWSWEQLLQYKQNNTLVALVVHSGKRLTTVTTKNVLLVVGSEAHGIPSEWIADCDTTVTLAMLGKTESLNAAVAASIALYILATS